MFLSVSQIKSQNFPISVRGGTLENLTLKSISQMYASQLARSKRETLLKINQMIDNLQSAPDFTPEIQQALKEQKNPFSKLRLEALSSDRASNISMKRTLAPLTFSTLKKLGLSPK